MKCLFIGGPIDGRTAIVHTGHVEVTTTSGSVSYLRGTVIDSSGNSHGICYIPGNEDPIVKLMEFYASSKHS